MLRCTAQPLRWILLVLCLGPWVPSFAQRPPDVTPGELALLPEYCPDTQGFNYGDATFNTSPRAAHWVRLMGPTFWHHHHYCWGLIKMQRARRPGLRPELRAGGFADAIGDFDYVIRHATPNFVLLPEVYFRMGEAYTEMGNDGLALQAFDGAVKAKPDYWPAYVSASAIYERLGLKDQARARIAAGLSVTPADPTLRQHYTRLGGNLQQLLRAIEAEAKNRPPLTTPGAAAVAAPSASAASAVTQ